MDEKTRNMLHELEGRWNTLTLADDFIFGKVMQDEEICREVLEAILGVAIDHIEYTHREESIDVSPEGRGVRLDAYVRDGKGTVYNVEMQASNTYELPQRSRYYQAMIALDLLGRGRPYRSLGHSYVIFVCGFDPFARGRRVYWFENRDIDDASLSLGDGTHTIFLAATAPRQPEKGERVNELLDYVSTGTVSGELSESLERAVVRVRENSDWRLEYMWQSVRDQLNLDKGREQGFEEGHEAGLQEGREAGLQEGHKAGLQEGHAQGLREGRDAGLEEGRKAGLLEGREAGLKEGSKAGTARFAQLVLRLISDGREADVPRAAEDEAFRDALFEAYHICN